MEQLARCRKLSLFFPLAISITHTHKHKTTKNMKMNFLWCLSLCSYNVLAFLSPYFCPFLSPSFLLSFGWGKDNQSLVRTVWLCDQACEVKFVFATSLHRYSRLHPTVQSAWARLNAEHIHTWLTKSQHFRVLSYHLGYVYLLCVFENLEWRGSSEVKKCVGCTILRLWSTGNQQWSWRTGSLLLLSWCASG